MPTPLDLIENLQKLAAEKSDDQNCLKAAQRAARLATERAILIERLVEIDEELDKLFGKGSVRDSLEVRNAKRPVLQPQELVVM